MAHARPVGRTRQGETTDGTPTRRRRRAFFGTAQIVIIMIFLIAGKMRTIRAHAAVESNVNKSTESAAGSRDCSSERSTEEWIAPPIPANHSRNLEPLLQETLQELSPDAKMTDGQSQTERLFPQLRPEVFRDEASGFVAPPIHKGFVSAFVGSLALIIISELGDKTFFIAALMSMRSAPLTVFAGAVAALILMTVLSTAAGYALPMLLDKSLTRAASLILFTVFGVKMLYDGYLMTETEGSAEREMAEVEAELNKKDDGSLKEMETESVPVELELSATTFDSSAPGVKAGNATSSAAPPSLSSAADSKNRRGALFLLWSQVVRLWETLCAKSIWRLLGAVFMQAFSLTFLAEWGDRSQVATIAMAAANHATGVALGACLGHIICTGLAVAGGRFLAAKISERAVTLIGGILFLGFALVGVLFNL